MKDTIIVFINKFLSPFNLVLEKQTMRLLGGRDAYAFLNALAEEKLNIIDIGAASGTREILDAFPITDYTHYLLEPNPAFSETLTDLAKQENVFYVPIAASNTAGRITFDSRSDPYKSTITDTSDVNKEELIEVEVDTLDSITDRFDCKGPYLLKVDVEGNEDRVLAGAAETLKQCRIVVLENWLNSARKNVDTAAIIQAMSTHGFRLFDVISPTRGYHNTLKQVDLVFVPEDHWVNKFGDPVLKRQPIGRVKKNG